MNVVRAEDISDFQKCERYYAYLKEKPELVSIKMDDRLRNRFQDAFRKTIIQFYFKASQGNVMDLFKLQETWEKLWFEGTSIRKILSLQHNPKENLVTYNTIAVSSLRVFREGIVGTPDIIYVDESCDIPLNSDTVLSGRIDLAQRAKGRTNLVVFSTERKRAPIERLRHKIATSILGYRHLTGEKEATVDLWHLSTSPPVKMAIEFKDRDLAQTVYWARRISEEKNFAPRMVPEDAICRSCPFRKPCWNDFDWLTLKP